MNRGVGGPSGIDNHFTYDRLICAERHAIFESFRMMLIKENILAIIIKENDFPSKERTVQ